MQDYSAAIELVRKLHRYSTGLEAANVIVKPLLAGAKLLGRTRLEQVLGSVDVLSAWSQNSNHVAAYYWKTLSAGPGFFRSAVVRSIAGSGVYLGSLNEHGTPLRYYDVMGIPVAKEPYTGAEGYYSPASPAEIIARLRESGSRWLINKDGELSVDASEVPETLACQTREIIAKIKPYTSCRAWVLWGPPRGGKSVAARQIAEANGGGWVRVCGAAATSPQVWEAVHALRPSVLILDDLDACAHAEDDLLVWLEQARAYARVIVSTMNILPREGEVSKAPAVRSSASDTLEVATSGASKARTEHELRGALLAPGRARDERPVHYVALDPAIRAELARDVPEDLRPEDLLAAYLVELQKRAVERGSVTEADVEEMRECMHTVGDR